MTTTRRHAGTRFLIGLLALVGLAATVGVVILVAVGVSARHVPSSLESRMARSARHLLIPAAARGRDNPVAPNQEAVARGRAHFADHCASCHGNDGKGRTMYGRGLSPRVPDLTLPATQELSDGELFWIIENGVRFTGMPAFGTDEPADAQETWQLVDFIRTLPKITPAEIGEMEKLNPTLSRADVERERADEEFLAGGPPAHSDTH
ncbi:MAG TPA: cytochrome c [Gaiellaceae bacterium]|nr:cytochrome c [Gaiellaceae bacterium]